MQVGLQARVRKETGKGAARKARREGLVPAVVYGKDVEPTALVVDRKEISKALSTSAGRNVLLQLKVEGRSEPLLVLPREIQRNPIKDDLLHIDFLAIRPDAKIQTEVPVVLEGKVPAASKGLVVETHLTSVSVECLPTDVPDRLEAPVELLADTGDQIKVRDLPVPEGVTVLTDPEEVIASLSLPPAAAAAEAAEAPEAAPAVAAEEESESTGSVEE